MRSHKLVFPRSHHSPVALGMPGPGLRKLYEQAPEGFWRQARQKSPVPPALLSTYCETEPDPMKSLAVDFINSKRMLRW